MRQVHKDEFDRIKREYEQVVTLLNSLAKKSSKGKAGGKTLRVNLPAYDPNVLETAIANAADAYALLLMAKAEGFMRAYLDSLSAPLGPEPKLSTLIDRCRKEFNKTKPKIPIQTDTANQVHDLRVQWNEYAHGCGSSVFPSIGRMVIILGRFFDQLP